MVEASIIAGAALAGAAAIQHFYDRYHPRGLYRRSLAIAVSNGDAIRNAVEGLRLDLRGEDGSESVLDLEALKTNFTELPNKIRAVMPDLSTLPAAIEAAVAGGIVRASTEVMKAQVGGLTGPEAGTIQSMGADAAQNRALTKSLKSAVGADMMGPYAEVLSEWAPTVYAWLREHPESVQWALEQPWLQGLIKRAASLVGQLQGPGSDRGGEWPGGLSV